MKRKYVLIAIVLIAALGIIYPYHLSSNRINPIAGVCGDPTNPNLCINPCTCAQGGCHPCRQGSCPSNTSDPNPSNPAILSITIAPASDTANKVALDSLFQYLPNTTYYITFHLTTDSSMNGFELTVLNGQNQFVGPFIRTDLDHTYLDTTAINNVWYISHNVATNFANWGFEWVSPSYATGPVTFYYAYNTSDSTAEFEVPAIPDGVIYAGTTTISASTAGIANITGLSNFNIYPNPSSDEFSLSFSLKKSETLSAYVYSVDGRLVKELMNNESAASGNFIRTFNISDLSSGIYMLRLSSGEASMTQKIIKL